MRLNRRGKDYGILVFTYLTQPLLKSIRKDEEPINFRTLLTKMGRNLFRKVLSSETPFLSVVQLSAILVSMGIGRDIKQEQLVNGENPDNMVLTHSLTLVSYFTNKFTPTVRIWLFYNNMTIGGEKITVGRR